MATTFVSWQVEYERACTALANKSWDEYFLQSVESRVQMRTSYTRLGNITDFIEWLKTMAAGERQIAETGIADTDGAIMFSIGGY